MKISWRIAAHSHLRDFFTFIGWGIAYGEIKQSPVDGSDIQAAGPLLVREMMAERLQLAVEYYSIV